MRVFMQKTGPGLALSCLLGLALPAVAKNSPATANQTWTVEIVGRGTSVQAGPVLFFTAGGPDYRILAAVDLADRGRILWSRASGAGYLALDKGTLYFVPRYDEPGTAKAFDPATGALQWEMPWPQLATMEGLSDGKLYQQEPVPDGSFVLRAIDLEQAAKIARSATASPSRDQIEDTSVKDGSTLWTATVTPGWFLGKAAGTILYQEPADTGRDEYFFSLLDAASGKQAWRITTGKSLRLLGVHGQLACLAAAPPPELGNARLPDTLLGVDLATKKYGFIPAGYSNSFGYLGVASNPVCRKNRSYYLGVQRNFQRNDRQVSPDPKLSLWELDLEYQVISREYPLDGPLPERYPLPPPVIREGVAYVTHTGDGNLYAFDLEGHRRLWKKPLRNCLQVRGSLGAWQLETAVFPGANRVLATSFAPLTFVPADRPPLYRPWVQAFSPRNGKSLGRWSLPLLLPDQATLRWLWQGNDRACLQAEWLEQPSAPARTLLIGLDL